MGLIPRRGLVLKKSLNNPLRKKQLQHSLTAQWLCDLRQLTSPSGLSFVEYKMGQ